MAASAIELTTTSKVTRRFVAFLVICYFVAYLDRVNVGFAKLTMDADLGIEVITQLDAQRLGERVHRWVVPGWWVVAP